MKKLMFVFLFALTSCATAPYNYNEHCSKTSLTKFTEYNENNSNLHMSVVNESVGLLLDAHTPDLLKCHSQYSSAKQTRSCMTFAVSKGKVDYVEVNDILNPLDKDLRSCLEAVIKRLDIKSLSINLPFAYMTEWSTLRRYNPIYQ